jgi:hypothetical protein
MITKKFENAVKKALADGNLSEEEREYLLLA